MNVLPLFSKLVVDSVIKLVETLQHNPLGAAWLYLLITIVVGG